jgi:hypothetical protein
MGLGNVIILNLVVKRPSGDAMIAGRKLFLNGFAVFAMR